MGDPNPERGRQNDSASLNRKEAVAGRVLGALSECWTKGQPGIALAAGHAIGTAYRYLQTMEIVGDPKTGKLKSSIQLSDSSLSNDGSITAFKSEQPNNKKVEGAKGIIGEVYDMPQSFQMVDVNNAGITNLPESTTTPAGAVKWEQTNTKLQAPQKDIDVAEANVSTRPPQIIVLNNAAITNSPESTNTPAGAVKWEQSNTKQQVPQKDIDVAEADVSIRPPQIVALNNPTITNSPESTNTPVRTVNWEQSSAKQQAPQKDIDVAEADVLTRPPQIALNNPTITNSRARTDNLSANQVDNSLSISNKPNSDVIAANGGSFAPVQDKSPSVEQKIAMQLESSNPQITEKSNILGQAGQTTIAQNDAGSGNQSSRIAMDRAGINVNSELAIAQTGKQIDGLIQAGGSSLDQSISQSLSQAVDSRFAELARVGQKEISVSDITNSRPGSLVISDAAAPANVQTNNSIADVSIFSGPGSMRDGSSFALGRDSNSSIAAQGLIAGQLSGFYSNDTSLNGQGALSVKESGASYLVAGSQEIGKGITSGLAGSASLAPTRGQGVSGQGVLQPGQGVGQVGELTPGGKINLVNAGSVNLAPTETTGKKGGATEGISVATIGSPLGLITTKGGKDSVGEVVDESKLPTGQIPNSQSPLASGLIVAATTSATVTTSTTDPNTKGAAATTGSGTVTIKNEDWENSLPEIDIIDSNEQDNIEPPVKQTEMLVHKEIDSDIDEDNDIESDPYVANEGKRGGGAFAPKSRATDNIRGLIEIIIADAAGKKLDDAKAKKLFDELFGDNTKRQYTVKLGDTIEEIALRMLKDKRLIPLLLNVNNINEKEMKGDYTTLLQAGTELELPTRSQILRYKIHVLNDSAPLMVYANTLSGAADKASSSNETNEFIAYTCRLGDTLKSIAKRHAAINDESQWEEIARLNELTTQCDENGQSIVVLNRGQKIYLPKPQAIVEGLEDEDEAESSVSSINSILSAGGYDLSIRNMKSENRAQLASPLREELISAVHDGQTVVSGASTEGKVLSLMGKMKLATEVLKAKDIAVVTRVITQSDLGEDDSNTLNLRLEMKVDNHWLPVVEYDIHAPGSGESSGLKVYDLYGVRHVIPLGLSTRAARELAENDITVNSQRYCQLFINNYQLAA